MKTEDALRMWQDEHARFARLLDFLDVQTRVSHPVNFAKSTCLACARALRRMAKSSVSGARASTGKGWRVFVAMHNVRQGICY